MPTSKGFYKVILHDPPKQVKRPTTAFRPTTKAAHQQAIPISRQKIEKKDQTLSSFQQQNQNKSTETVNRKKNQKTRYSQSLFSKQSQLKNIQSTHLKASNPAQNFSFNRNLIPLPE